MAKRPANKTDKKQTKKAAAIKPAANLMGLNPLQQAKRRLDANPDDANARKAYGIWLVRAGELGAGAKQLEIVCGQLPDDAEAHAWRGVAYYHLDNPSAAREATQAALAADADNGHALWIQGLLKSDAGHSMPAFEDVERALKLIPNEQRIRDSYALMLHSMSRFDEAIEQYQALIEQAPNSWNTWNSLGNVYRDLADLPGASRAYQKALDQAGEKGKIPYSNLLTLSHYDPELSRKALFDLSQEWQARFAPVDPPPRPVPVDLSPGRRLRIGLFSDGFRSHPVGNMIVEAIAALNPAEVELFFYPTHSERDHVTQRLERLADHWTPIKYLNDDAFAAKLREDRIDILFDLAGHNNGTRSRTVALNPAPLIVKWVGGLINTTGVEAIDYLLSDHVESPAGLEEDACYTEKLIRLPDDYIVYSPPGYAPDVSQLPAKDNGYVTLGCFNNPTKLNDVVLKEWAKLLHQLPDAQLLLKGKPFISEAFCERIRRPLLEAGIAAERIITEGPASHRGLLEAYNRVDIALDPWPYSGGVTTCEALYMGVPTVTLPGPTFAGRHSATHLVNAGMPELVVDSWEEYRARVVELAGDLDSLATIRTHLRELIQHAPLCNGRRFARHLMLALRAIWQRYCEGKAPEALTFNQKGELWFEDDKQPLSLSVSPKPPSTEGGFVWPLESSVIGLDNSAILLRSERLNATHLQTLPVSMVCFDAAQSLSRPGIFGTYENIEYHPGVQLGDGQPATLYSCFDPAMTATLPPLPDAQLPAFHHKGVTVLARHTVQTLALDSIEGLNGLDWLVLDETSDALSILEHGETALQSLLLLHVHLALQPTHQGQADLGQLQRWASGHGLRFLRLDRQGHRSHFPVGSKAAQMQTSELVYADALFIPSYARIAKLTDDQRTKLAFLLHTVYGIKDMAYALLAEVDEKKAEEYLNSINTNTIQEKQATTSNLGELKSVTISDEIDNLLNENAVTLASVPETVEPRLASPQTVAARSGASKNQNLWELDDPIHVVDIGANPIDGTPPYAGLLKRGLVKLTGFEPQQDALQKLQAMKGPNETYLPHAVGTGERTKLYVCQASGMTSTLKPNNQVLNHFQGYPIWGKVKSVEEIDTVRLDDVATIEKIDWLKIDIQGGELNVFKNAEKLLKNTLVIQTEVNFIQLYENQPLFAEIDQWMRENGFMLHTLLEQRKRLYAPMKINGGIHQGINQLTTADAVYIPNFDRLKRLPQESLKKVLHIMHEAYQSYDYVLKLIVQMKEKKESIKYSKKAELLPESVRPAPGSTSNPLTCMAI